MNLNLAYKILSVDDSYSEEEIEDAFDLKCFTIKKEILMQSTFLTSFLDNKVRLLKQLNQAKQFISGIKEVDLVVEPQKIKFDAHSLKIFFTQYEKEIVNVKHALSSSISVNEIISSILNLKQIQETYVFELANFEFDMSKVEELPLKKQIDSGVIIRELQKMSPEHSNSFLKELSRVKRLSKLFNK